MRIGIGFDVHRLVKGERKLILGGTEIPFDYYLKGHSDADVLTHALIDAILGALGEGDIGQHFPDNEEMYRDISSLKLLSQIAILIKEKKYRLNNADLILIAQKPRMADYRSQIADNLSRVLKIESSRINFKATTTERLGVIGEGRGIAAQAIVSLL